MSALNHLYQQVIIDHSKLCHGQQPLRALPTHPGFGSSRQYNPLCGDDITFEVEQGPEGLHVRWDGEGCSLALASASVLSELIEELNPHELEQAQVRMHELMHSQGKPIADVEILGDGQAFAGTATFPMRIKCVLLAWIAFAEAHRQAQQDPEF